MLRETEWSECVKHNAIEKQEVITDIRRISKHLPKQFYIENPIGSHHRYSSFFQNIFQNNSILKIPSEVITDIQNNSRMKIPLEVTTDIHRFPKHLPTQFYIESPFGSHNRFSSNFETFSKMNSRMKIPPDVITDIQNIFQ
jgi:hypothetical protein